MGTNLDFQAEVRHGVLHLSGELDLASREALREALQEQLARSGDRAVVDLGGVGFLDSTALYELLEAARAAAPTCRVVLANVQPQVRRVIEVTGLREEFTLDPPG